MVRATLRAKVSKAAKSSNSTSVKSHPARPPIIQPTKKDKRLVRHNALLSRVASSAAITKSSKKNAKRKEARSAKQNLITGLESLADALPSADDEDEWEDWEHDVFDNSSKEAMKSLQKKTAGQEQGKMKMNTIKSKPGAQKKKEKLLREECVRFGKNLAIMNTATVKTGELKETKTSGISSWAALRGFIANTIEKKEEFAQIPAGHTASDGMDVDA